MPLISYDKDRWPERKMFYRWIDDEGFNLPANELCNILHITSPVLTKYLGRFDYVRRGVLNEKNGFRASINIPKKHIAHFRSNDVYDYLQNAVSCTRRTRIHYVDENIEKEAEKAFDNVIKECYKEKLPPSYPEANYEQYLVYCRAGYNPKIAYMLTDHGVHFVSRKWYKFPQVKCDTPAAWYMPSENHFLSRGDSSKQNREMSQRSWLISAAVAIRLQSSTTNQALVLHYTESRTDQNGHAVPACFTDDDLRQPVLPLLNGWELPDYPKDDD